MCDDQNGNFNENKPNNQKPFLNWIRTPSVWTYFDSLFLSPSFLTCGQTYNVKYN